MEIRKKIASLVFCLFFLSIASTAQETNVGLFFYTTSYSFGDSTAFLEKQANTIKDDLMYSYGFRTSSYPNYTKVNLLNSIENECSADSSKQLFIYLSGRSYLEKDDIFLILNSSDSLKIESMISLKDLVQIVENCNAQHVMLFIDAPGAGQIEKQENVIAVKIGEPDTNLTAEKLTEKAFLSTSVYVIGDNSDSTSLSGNKRYTPLSGKFLEALRNFGEVDGIIPIEELSYYINNIEPQPFIGTIKEKGEGNFLFITK